MNEQNKTSYQRKKDKLRSCLYLKDEIRRLESKILHEEEQKMDLMAIRGMTISDMPHGGEKVEFDDRLARILDKIDCLCRQKDRRELELEQIKERIEALEDYDYKRILKFIYFDRMTIPQIAREMFLSESAVKKKHKRAILTIRL